MAQMDTGGDGGSRKGGGKVRSKKADLRIDFTPMVDLGFLLITFFMLTTTLSKPQIMPLIFPEKKIQEDKLEPVKESKVMTILLGANDKVYYYEGITDPKLDSTDFSAEGIRSIILDKKRRVAKLFPEEEKTKTNKDGEEVKYMSSQMTVIIKATQDARYKNVVDIFDEMAITKVVRYVLLDISEAEKEFIKYPEKGLNFTVADQADAATN